MLLNVCDNPDVLSVMRLLIITFNIIKIVIPIIIIGFLIFDYSKVIGKGDGIKDANINATKRIIAALIIFFLPTGISLFASLTEDNIDYSKCITNATEEGINNAYSLMMDSYINKALDSLSIEDYKEAVTYSKQIKDENLKKEIDSKLKDLNKKVEIYNDVGVLYSSDKKPTSYVHGTPFYVKLTDDDKKIYYCVDNNDTCEPNIKYTEQLWFSKNGKQYLRYKLCNEDNECSKVSSYEYTLGLSLERPNVSTSTGDFGTYHKAAYYYQCDDRWENYDVYSGVTMCDVGCGYNAYAMLMTGITHDYSITPITLFEKLSEIRKETGYQFQSLSTGGGLLNEAIHENKEAKKEYGYQTSELWNDYEYVTSDLEKKEKIVESLKMGHMIFMRVPVHFISLVGIDEDENIYIYDPGWKSWKLDIDSLYSTYYDYNNNCTDGEECGMKIAYEVYASGGTSLDTWKLYK